MMFCYELLNYLELLLFLEESRENDGLSEFRVVIVFITVTDIHNIITRIKIPTCGAFRGNSASNFDKQVLPDTLQPVDPTSDRYCNEFFNFP